MPHLYSTRCWLDNQLQPATISFDNGIITHIYQGKLNNPNVVDVGDDVLMPGCIDVHAHINEPGRTDWEGFDTATQAAAAGGITTVIDMPLNSSPVTTTVAAFEQKLAASNGKMHVNCGFYGGLVPDNLQHLTALVDAGVLGIKAFLVHSGIDEFPNVGRKELDAAMAILAPYNVPLLAHCEIYDTEPPELLNNLAQHPQSYACYLASRPKQWENDAVLLMIDLCRKHGCKTHIVHLSSAEALPYIAQAKQEGLPLTVETCPHYLLFSAETIPDGNTLYKCAPPIREKANNDKLWDALKDGVIDFVEEHPVISTGVAVAGTAATGGVAAAFAPQIAAAAGAAGLLGTTATTGTAIATLHGAALTNASLAALGGGAISVGGAGMAGGTMVVGAAGVAAGAAAGAGSAAALSEKS